MARPGFPRIADCLIRPALNQRISNMAGYIPRTGAQKKKNILRQRELALRGDIRREASEEKLLRSAERVRSARLGVIKSLIHEAEPARSEDEEGVTNALRKLADANDYWHHISVREIVEMYSGEGDDEVFVDRKKWWDFRPR